MEEAEWINRGPQPLPRSTQLPVCARAFDRLDAWETICRAVAMKAYDAFTRK